MTTLRPPRAGELRLQIRAAIRSHPAWRTHAKAHNLNIAKCDLGTPAEHFMTNEELATIHRALWSKDFEPAMVEARPDDDTRVDDAESELDLDPEESLPLPTPLHPTTPARQPAVVSASTDKKIEALGRMILDLASSGMDEERVVELIHQHSTAPATVNLHISGAYDFRLIDRPVHYMFPALLAAVAAGVAILMVGPAGSGKTTAADMVAQALSRSFDFTGAVQSEYKLTGFRDAQGRVVETAFVRQYTNGGVFLFDELDASAAQAVLSWNAAIANGFADFPAGKTMRHPDFIPIAAANTFGRGQSREYVGRNQQDAAALDRYTVLAWDYDPALEAAIVGLPRPAHAPAMVQIRPITDETLQRVSTARWFSRVQTHRAAVEKAKVRHIVSPRATIAGAKLLIAGWPSELVEEGTIWKGLPADDRAKVKAAL